MELSYWAQMARAHWEQYLPKRYQELKEQGILQQELEKAAESVKDMMGDLAEQGLRRNEVLEIVLPQFILLPPERIGS